MQTISPLSATVEPVRRFAKAMGDMNRQQYWVVRIPENTKCFDMGYRYASVPHASLQAYLDNGATLAH
jgi:hypothetical protein